MAQGRRRVGKRRPKAYQIPLTESRSILWKDKFLGHPPKVESQDPSLILRVEPFEIPDCAAAKVAAVNERD
jgi:hypothetical protein